MPDFRLPLLYDEVLMGRVTLTERDMRSMLKAMRFQAREMMKAADVERESRLAFAADCLLMAEEVLAPEEAAREARRAAA